ncbi:MAG: formylglycine-generating enzyme family protein, partial [Acidobacteriota bacterium]
LRRTLGMPDEARRLARGGHLSLDLQLAHEALDDVRLPQAQPLLAALVDDDAKLDDDDRFHLLQLLKHETLRKGWSDARLDDVADGEAQRTGREVVRALDDGSQERVAKMARELLGVRDVPSVRRAPEGGDERTHAKDGSVLVYVPSGRYTLGGTAYSVEKPIHTVTLDSYWIGKYPVTNAQYRAFLEATGHAAPEFWEDAQLNGDPQPVVGVSWHDAQAYCAWAGLQLASEAQWEAAARGDDQREYPWGNDAPTKALANFGETGVGRTTPVGSYPQGAGPFGTLDQAGNVWEWCADAWSDHAYRHRDRKKNPVHQAGDDEAAVRLVRGGAWDDWAEDLRAAYRNGYVADNRRDDVGFRVSGFLPEHD